MGRRLVRHPAKLSAWDAWRALAGDPGRVALETRGTAVPGRPRWSIVASRPRGRILWREGGVVLEREGRIVRRFPAGDPLGALRESLAAFGGRESLAALRREAETAGQPRTPFAGGAIGWRSYEL